MSRMYRDPFSITGFFNSEILRPVSNQSAVIAIGILTRRENLSQTRNCEGRTIYPAPCIKPNYISYGRRIYARIELQLSIWQRWFSLHCNGIYSVLEIPIFQIDLQIELRRVYADWHATILLQICTWFLNCRQDIYLKCKVLFGSTCIQIYLKPLWLLFPSELRRLWRIHIFDVVIKIL